MKNLPIKVYRMDLEPSQYRSIMIEGKFELENDVQLKTKMFDDLNNPDLDKKKGLSMSDWLELILTFGANISAGVVAAYLYDYFKKSKVPRIYIKNKKVEINDQEKTITIIKKIIETK